MFEKTWNPALFLSSSARASVRLRAKQRPLPITTLFGPAILFKESKISCGKTITNFVDYFGAAQLLKVIKASRERDTKVVNQRSRGLHLPTFAYSSPLSIVLIMALIS